MHYGEEFPKDIMFIHHETSDNLKKYEKNLPQKCKIKMQLKTLT
jgi:hypothetical protein